MFGDDEVRENFRATMSVLGRPVTVISPGRMGTRRAHAEPALFYFYYSRDRCIVTVGDLAGRQYVGLDKDGYLCVKDRAEDFTLLDSESNAVVKNYLPQGKIGVHMYASDRARVMQFDGDDAYDDLDTLYNFLIAGRKIRSEDSNGDVFYYVPTGDGAWVKHPAHKPYTATPVQIVLDVK